MNKMTEIDKDLKQIYNNVLSNYIILNKIFGFNNPIEVFSLFIVAYPNGYLSNNHVFEYASSSIDDIQGMSGISVINGKCKSRQISEMLSDVYCNLNIENLVLPVSSESELIYSGYAINAVSKQDDILYFDPTRFSQYIKYAKDLLYDDETIVKILFENISQKNNSSFKERIIEDLNCNHPSIPSEEVKTILYTARKIARNLDMLEKFYNENKDYYAEISDKILTLTR